MGRQPVSRNAIIADLRRQRGRVAAAGAENGGGRPWYRDSHTGDGTTTQFLLSHVPVFLGEALFVNGLHQHAYDDYSLSGRVVTFDTAPAAGDKIQAWYQYSTSAESDNPYPLIGTGGDQDTGTSGSITITGTQPGDLLILTYKVADDITGTDGEIILGTGWQRVGTRQWGGSCWMKQVESADEAISFTRDAAGFGAWCATARAYQGATLEQVLTVQEAFDLGTGVLSGTVAQPQISGLTDGTYRCVYIGGHTGRVGTGPADWPGGLNTSPPKATQSGPYAWLEVEGTDEAAAIIGGSTTAHTVSYSADDDPIKGNLWTLVLT